MLSYWTKTLEPDRLEIRNSLSYKVISVREFEEIKKIFKSDANPCLSGLDFDRKFLSKSLCSISYVGVVESICIWYGLLYNPVN